VSSPPHARIPDRLPDTLLVTLPGLQAEAAARALTLEGMICGLECEGFTTLRRPDQQPEEPFAVTLPVAVYVHHTQRSEAQRILDSLAGNDLIGDQWAHHRHAPMAAPADDEPVSREHRLPQPPQLSASYAGPSPPRAEGTTLRFLLLLALGGVLLFVALTLR
jgi:hypothetical protein